MHKSVVFPGFKLNISILNPEIEIWWKRSEEKHHENKLNNGKLPEDDSYTHLCCPLSHWILYQVFCMHLSYYRKPHYFYSSFKVFFSILPGFSILHQFIWWCFFAEYIYWKAFFWDAFSLKALLDVVHRCLTVNQLRISYESTTTTYPPNVNVSKRATWQQWIDSIMLSLSFVADIWESIVKLTRSYS